MNLVLKAAPEIGNTYGIILPKIRQKISKQLTDRTKTPDPWAKFLNGLFAGKILSWAYTLISNYCFNLGI